MPALQLSSHPAVRRPSGAIVVAYAIDGRAEPLGRRIVLIHTSADARRALEAYAADLQATGASARADADLLPGERAPRGFQHLDLRAYVNLALAETDHEFTGETVIASMLDQDERF